MTRRRRYRSRRCPWASSRPAGPSPAADSPPLTPSIAGLPGTRACVRVGPPLSASGARFADSPVTLPVVSPLIVAARKVLDQVESLGSETDTAVVRCRVAVGLDGRAAEVEVAGDDRVLKADSGPPRHVDPAAVAATVPIAVGRVVRDGDVNQARVRLGVDAAAVLPVAVFPLTVLLVIVIAAAVVDAADSPPCCR